MFRNWLGGIGIRDLCARVWEGAGDDNIFGAAAELAYYSLLSFFPLLIFLTSLIGFLAGLRTYIMDGLARVVPRDAVTLIDHVLQDVVQGRSGGVLSLGIIGALWAASNGASGLMDTLNTAYGVRERRPFWKTRLIALGLTVGLSALVASGSAVIMFGDKLAGLIVRLLDLNPKAKLLFGFADYPVGIALLLLGLQCAYYFGPDRQRNWRWITPGAAFAVVASAICSLLFSAYLRFAPSYSATYGSLGAVVVLMLWQYLIGLAVLLGGEINGQIEDITDHYRVKKG